MSARVSVLLAPHGGNLSENLTLARRQGVRTSDRPSGFLTLAGRHIPVLTSAFDTTETTPVSTTVGLGIAPRVKLGHIGPDPSLEEFIAVAAFDPRPLGQRHEVIRIDPEQDERIGRQVAVSLADRLNAHDVELSVEVTRELEDRIQALGVRDENRIVADDTQARHDGALGQPVAAKAGLVNAKVEQRDPDVARVALCAAMPHDPVNAARVDAERGFPVVVARAQADATASLAASGYVSGDVIPRARVRREVEMAQRFVACGHAGNRLMARRVTARSDGTMSTLLDGSEAGPAISSRRGRPLRPWRGE